ncbi:hypothetical protein ThvES_00020710, partial [Thiovulum sp. ES]
MFGTAILVQLLEFKLDKDFYRI